MKLHLSWLLATVALLTLNLMPSEMEARLATFDVGYGTKAKGMGGAAVAYAQDSLVGAINPAGVAWIGTRWDQAFQFYSFRRKYAYNTGPVDTNGTQIGDQGHYVGHPQYRLIPSSGATYDLDEYSTIGYASYGVGGYTQYNSNNPLTGTAPGRPLPPLTSQKLSLNLIQYMASLSYARWINDYHSVGLSAIVSIATLRVKGFYAFDNAATSISPGNVTDRGTDYAFGFGLRLGWLGKVADKWTVGASLTSPIWYTRFDRYRGLFTDRAQINAPPALALGATYQWRENSNLSFEYQRVFYTDASAGRVWGNSIGNFVAAGGAYKAGEKQGPGFGWRDANFYKLGMDYRSPSLLWDIRAGIAYVNAMFKPSEIDVNIVTQDVSKMHLTAGATYHWGLTDIDLALFHAINVNVRGQSRISTPTMPDGLGKVRCGGYQYGIELNIGKYF